jgi:hypothetical protein
MCDLRRPCLLTRLEKRMEAQQRVKLDGFQMVISELEVEQDYLRRAKRYLEVMAVDHTWPESPAAAHRHVKFP